MSETKALKSVVTRESNVMVVDSSSGEIIDSSSEKTVRYLPGASYLKAFYKNPMFHTPMPHASRTLLFAMASLNPHIVSQTTCVFIEGESRQKIKDEYGLCESTLKKSLSWLVENGYVRKCGRGMYEVNPYLYARGQSISVLQKQKEWDNHQDSKRPS